VRQSAELLGITIDSVRDLIAAGDLPAHRLSERRTRIRRADLDAFVAGHKVA
jgi:excisionase family DNA binding protein